MQTTAKDSLGADQTISSTPKFAVPHYTVAELACLWKLSEETVRKLFEQEPRVPVIGNQQPRYGRRQYSTLRIPEFVVERVYRGSRDT